MKGIVSMRNLGCRLLLWFGATTTLAAEEFDRVVGPFFQNALREVSWAGEAEGEGDVA